MRSHDGIGKEFLILSLDTFAQKGVVGCVVTNRIGRIYRFVGFEAE
jgi:hypothetical protein